MITGLRPKEPIGACLVIGVKGPKGFPIDTDRFYITLPQEVDGVRPLHPAFKSFNEAQPDKRVSLRGNLVHAGTAGCFEHRRKAQVLPKFPAHPARAPHCMCDDGVTARRWLDGAFKDVPCPGDLCEYTKPYTRGDGKEMPSPCKPFARLLFRPRWPEASAHLPSPLMKYTTGGWNTTQHLAGFFEHVHEQARLLGAEGFSLYGLPFTLTLLRKRRAKTDGEEARLFSIVTMAPDGDLLEFLYAQRKRVAELGPPPAFAALTDHEEQDDATLTADTRAISGPMTVPGGG